MRSYMLGLMASSVVGFTPALAEDLLPCGNAFYVASQYTCYDSNKLCPIENGQPTEPCGEDCYLQNMYSCDNGRLAPPAPSEDGTFQVVALKTPYFESSFVQASGLVFSIGAAGPATYCPDEVAQSSGCPPGTETVWTCTDGFCGLTVEVPGGQQIYVAPNGAVGYTQAHSAYAPPGSQFTGFSVKNGELRFGDGGFLACPPADNSSIPQLYVDYPQVLESDDCYEIKLVTAKGNEPGFAAWQYT